MWVNYIIVERNVWLSILESIQKFDRIIEQLLRLLNAPTNCRKADPTSRHEFEEMEDNSDTLSLIPTNFSCCQILGRG
jgi:hypothetical protein